MSLEEAIKHCEEEVERIERNHPYIDVTEYRQIAEWLIELKAWRRMGELLNELLTKEQIKKLKEKRRNDT